MKMDMKTQRRREFAEDFGILFERMGFPCMAGRIWGWLLIADQPQQTAAQIADGISASRGSVSTMTGMLIQQGLVERVGVPGQRSKCYRIKYGGFTEILRNRVRLGIEVRNLTERGLELIKDDSPEVRRNLEEYVDLWTFFVREFPALIEKWEKERAHATK